MKASLAKLGLLMSLPGVALAHTDAGQTTGFLQGLGHPMGGVDHLLAMLAVGLWAMQIGGRACWWVPTTFVGVMIGGGILGLAGVPLPFVETGISVSVCLLGLLIAGACRLPLAYSAMLVGTFAIFHGHAHGTEMPFATGAVSYTIGFALATALLHLAGMGLGGLMQKVNLQTAVRCAGGAIALGGIYLVVS